MKDVIFEDYAAEKTKARLLAEILILTEDTDKSQLALDLFHTLDNRIRSQGWFEVEVRCICLQNHRMSIWVACLMSEVQTRGIQLLNVERVSAWCDLKGFALRDLSCLVASQQGVIQRLFVERLCVSNQDEAEAIVTLLERSHALHWNWRTASLLWMTLLLHVL